MLYIIHRFEGLAELKFELLHLSIQNLNIFALYNIYKSKIA